MDYNFIKVQEKQCGEVTEITLCNPPGNVLSLAMMQEIAERMKLDVKNPHKKLIVFAAEGEHFSFGASVEEHTADKVSDMLPYFHSLLSSIIRCPVPTLVRVSGLCLGGAFEFVLACTFIFADESAKFGLPEILLGVFPPPACILLPARAGDAVSVGMILSGDQMEAAALHPGLISLLVKKGALDAAVNDFFENKIKPKSASSIRVAHKASRVLLADLFDKQIVTVEQMYLNELMKTSDANEGIRAFMEKRPPLWRDA
jgi:cyclohexa-1,5-dienecarbonyl-CoA hydratase